MPELGTKYLSLAQSVETLLQQLSSSLQMQRLRRYTAIAIASSPLLCNDLQEPVKAFPGIPDLEESAVSYKFISRLDRLPATQ